jgi:hypothetical protein
MIWVLLSNGEFEINGFLQNLKFQKSWSGFYQKINRKACLIQTATYLKSVANKTNNQIMVYTMVDMDNKDGKIRYEWY